MNTVTDAKPHRSVVTATRHARRPATAPPRRYDPRPTLFVAVDSAAALAAVAVAGGTQAGALAFVSAAVAIDLLDRRQHTRLTPSALDDVPALAIRALAIATVATAAGLRVHGDRVPGAHHGAGPLAAALLYVAAGVLGRAGAYAVLRRVQADGRMARPAVVVGAGPMGTRIATRLRHHPEHGFTPVGFLDVGSPARQDQLPVPLLGHVTELPKVIAEYGVRHVFVAFCQTPDANLVDLLRECDRLRCEVFVVPRLFELGLASSPEPDHLWGVPLLRLRRAPFRSRTWLLKRAFDIAFATLALLLVSPLVLAIALAVRLEVGRGVLFRQTRVGLDGRPFRLLKFRTLKPQPQDTPTVWSVAGAERMGTIGRFLRRSSLDELPQLWNVLRGQMSLVGPRPEQPPYVALFSRRYRGYHARLRVPAGVTGWAQIHDLRGATPIADRVTFDNFYIEHWSLWQDIKIVIRTVASVFGMRGG